MIKKNWKQFKQNFFKQCCQLVCEAKPDSKPKYLFEKKYKGRGIKKEDLVTDDYIEKINKISRDEGLNIWAMPEVRQRNIVDEDSRGNPDITFYSAPNLNAETCFECKILGDNSKYVVDGVKRFVDGKYIINRDMPCYGMLGYVKDEKAIDRCKTLQSNIRSKGKELFLENETNKKNSDDEIIFETEHNVSVSGGKKLVISHILHSWDK